MTWTNVEISRTQNWTQLNCTKYLLVEVLHEHANHMAYTYMYTHVCMHTCAWTHVCRHVYIYAWKYNTHNRQQIDNENTAWTEHFEAGLEQWQWWASSSNIRVFNNLIQEATNRKKYMLHFHASKFWILEWPCLKCSCCGTFVTHRTLSKPSLLHSFFKSQTNGWKYIITCSSDAFSIKRYIKIPFNRIMTT